MFMFYSNANIQNIYIIPTIFFNNMYIYCIYILYNYLVLLANLTGKKRCFSVINLIINLSIKLIYIMFAYREIMLNIRGLLIIQKSRLATEVKAEFIWRK